MGLAHRTPVVSCGLTSNRFAGPWSGPTDLTKTRDLIRACPLKRVARHWSVRCLYSRKIPQKVLTKSIGASAMYPECRAAVSMVTGHQQPDPRVGRPGRESNPMSPRSQGGSDIQSQGASEERSSWQRRRLVSWSQSRRVSHRAKGPSGPFCARERTPTAPSEHVGAG
jgi:hypothetical protein